MSNLITTPESVLPAVLAAMSHGPDARLREVMDALVRHLHAFVQEVKLSEPEFERALDFIVALGQATGDKKNEVVLAADMLGVSTLVAVLNHPGDSGESSAALVGPFWRANAPLCEPGDNIARGDTPGMPLTVSGVVRDDHGRPIAGATVDAWQASPVGLYENQDDTQPDMNLRGRFVTDTHGRYVFRSVVPAGYPVPTDGPCGELLRAQRRHPNRPAHLHFIVSQPGFAVRVSQVFADTDKNLDSDPVFGVTRALIGHFEIDADGRSASLQHDFTLRAGRDGLSSSADSLSLPEHSSPCHSKLAHASTGKWPSSPAAPAPSASRPHGVSRRSAPPACCCIAATKPARNRTSMR